jgi:hypothetical protein
MVTALEVPPEEKETARGARYVWVASGFLAGDDSVIIRGTRYPRFQPIGSFGYQVRHDGPVEQWVYGIAGAKRIGDNLFVLEVPPGRAAQLTTTVTPSELALTPQLSFHVGSDVPLGGFASNIGPGPCFVLDAGCRFMPNLTGLLLAGASLFMSSPTTLGTYWLNANAVLRGDLPLGGSTYLYADLGAGIYLPKGGPIEPGGNFGLGADWRLSRHLTLELGSEAHATLTSATVFVQATFGAIWRF